MDMLMLIFGKIIISEEQLMIRRIGWLVLPQSVLLNPLVIQKDLILIAETAIILNMPT